MGLISPYIFLFLRVKYLLNKCIHTCTNKAIYGKKKKKSLNAYSSIASSLSLFDRKKNRRNRLSCTKMTILQCKDLVQPCSQPSLCQSQLLFEVYIYIELKHGPCQSSQLVYYESTPCGYKIKHACMTGRSVKRILFTVI